MVTPEDYTCYHQSETFLHLINDIISWGGQDNPEPTVRYSVFSAIDFEDDVTATTQANN